MELNFDTKKDNVVKIVKEALSSGLYDSNLEFIEVSEEEYLKETEEIYKNNNYQCIDTKFSANACID